MSDGNADNSLHSNAIGWAILLVVFAALAWLFWYFNDAQVRSLIRWIRYGEMWLISFFVDEDFTVPFNGQLMNWQAGFETTPNYRAEELGYIHLSYFTALAMQPFKYVFMGLCALGAFWVLFYGPQTQYRSKLNLEGLIRRQASNFPAIAPFIDFNPGTMPPRPPGAPVPAELPLFAEALGPEEWLAYHSIPAPDGQLDEKALKTAFQKQLIGRWKGPMALEPYQQILLAAFCLKAARKRKESDAMLGRLALCWSAKKGLNLRRDKKLLREAKAVLKNKDLAGGTLRMTNRHAFVTTALIRALTYAREEGGVLAPAQFVWLRGHDRRLWYPLNNAGRQSFHMEALGAMSHYRAEKITQRPIPVPKMEHAIETMQNYMQSARARPIPSLDYSGSNKRGIKKVKS